MNHTNKNKLSSLSKQFLTNKDISILMDVGMARARLIRLDFEKSMNEQGIELYLDRIPTELFVEFYGINEKRILKYAELEK